MKGHHFRSDNCFHHYFQTGRQSLLWFSLTGVRFTGPTRVPVCSHHTPSSVLPSPSHQQSSLPADEGAWDSSYQRVQGTEIQACQAVTGWLNLEHYQNDWCLLRAWVGWLRSSSSCTTELLTRASTEAGWESLPASVLCCHPAPAGLCLPPPTRKGQGRFHSCCNISLGNHTGGHAQGIAIIVSL